MGRKPKIAKVEPVVEDGKRFEVIKSQHGEYTRELYDVKGYGVQRMERWLKDGKLDSVMLRIAPDVKLIFNITEDDKNAVVVELPSDWK